MRVIAGSAGGIPLKVSKTLTRPTSERVRESLFAILGRQVRGARVLDLFAGSGALGLEALSRGAASAVAVDSDRRAADVIRENAAKCRLDSLRVVAADVFRFLRRPGPRPFTLVFADPPYVKRSGEPDFGAALLGSEELARLVDPGGIFVLESASDAEHGGRRAWSLEDRRAYGSTALWFFRRVDDDDGRQG